MQITISIAGQAITEQAVAVIASVMPNNDKEVKSTQPVQSGTTLTLEVPPGTILSIEPYVVGA